MAPTTVQQPSTASNSSVARFGYWSGIAAFITWFAMGADSVLRPIQDNRRDTFWFLPALLTAVTFVCVHLLQRRRSRTEFIGFVMVMLATGLLFIGNIGMQLDIKPLLWLGVPGGPIVWTIGMVCFGIGTLMARALPPYGGWALILFEPGSVLTALALKPIAPMLDRGAYSGNLEKGLAILLVALAIRRCRSSR